jgi:hypothetical protein
MFRRVLPLGLLLANVCLCRAADDQPPVVAPASPDAVAKAVAAIGFVAPGTPGAGSLQALIARGIASAPVVWPQVGAETPGTLSYLYNVTGLKEHRDKFHCLVTEYGLDPTIMVVVRGQETLESKAVGELLKKIDAQVTENYIRRLHAYVVVLDPSVRDVVKDDVPRYRLKKVIEAFVKDENRKLSNGDNVPFCICSRNYLKEFPIPDDAAVTIVFERNHRVQLSSAFEKDKLTEEDATKLLTDGVKKILPAK